MVSNIFAAVRPLLLQPRVLRAASSLRLSSNSSEMPSYSSATPFASVYHAPVMIDEILDQLDRLATKSTSAAPLARIIDLTCGGGGHSEAFLTYLRAQNLNHVEVIGVDRDSDSKEEASQRLKDFPNFHHCLKNFGDLTPDDLGGPVDFVLGDLGVSSHQIDDPSRGFRYGGNVKGGVAGPLDMRMDGNNGLSAADIVNDYPEEALLKILVDHGGEKYMSAKRIVAEIVRSRPMTRTDELTAAIERVTPKWSKSSPRKGALKTKARVFQAIRVAVNDEMGSLNRLFENVLPSIVREGGVCCILTYQSDEDAIVKAAFKSHHEVDGKIRVVKDREIGRDLYGNKVGPGKKVWDILNKGKKASEDEMKKNNRARSARLRVAERILS